ncbi:hypothetical protein SUDANB121_00309 [Nocardiopsis dassonvillei]|uniref:hypothetical protein n=1 Tax=Nocardiopsis dassonvillei TaxID=2014 RepID=UPI003F57B2B5
MAHRALSAVGRRYLRWCEVCRIRLATRSGPRHGRRRPELQVLYIDAPPTFRGYARAHARYLCDGCRGRNAEARAAREARHQRDTAAAVERFRRWLRAAPVLSVPISSLKGFEGRLPEDPFFWHFAEAEPFAEIMSVEELVRDVNREPRHTRSIRLNSEHFDWRMPERMPATYEEAVEFHDGDDGYTLVWKGSVYRLDDGRIALHRRPLEMFHLD